MRLVLLLALVVAEMASRGMAQTVDADVLVIGAGVAAVKAAADLLAAGITVTVLEARGRALGRIDTRQDASWPIPIELGAQWFHGGTGDNAVLAYAKSAAFNPVISTVVTPDSEGVVFNGGAAVEDAVDNSWEALYDDFDGTFMPQYRKSKGKSVALTTPLSEAVDAFVKSRSLTGLALQGFMMKIQTYIVQEYGANTENLNLQLWDDDTEYRQDDSIPKSGYASVFAKLLAAIGSRLVLNTEVTKISYNSATSAANRPFRVETTKGTYTARYVICTLPLGVLQAKLTTLFPGKTASSSWLSAAKVTAIRGLGMGTMNKVVLQFPSAFWEQKSYRQSWIDRISSNPKQPYEFFSLSKATGQPILVAFYVGNAAVAAESMSDSETLAQVAAALQDMFGSSYQAPTNTLITRWTQDPYALGSYSYVKVGSGAKDARWQLGQPEANKKLWFAGEAADEVYPSTVQGAWRSGAKAAAALVKVYKKAAKAAAAARAAAAADDEDD